MSDQPNSPASNFPKRTKSYAELAKEFPTNPGVRMLAEAEVDSIGGRGLAGYSRASVNALSAAHLAASRGKSMP